MNPKIRNDRIADIVFLGRGTHKSPDDGFCLMEAVAYVAGSEHTDNPACVSPILVQAGRNLSDVLPYDLRQELIPLIPYLLGTVNDGHDETREFMALDWLVRIWLPTWLELIPGCRDDVAKLRGLEPIVDFASAERTISTIRAAECCLEAFDRGIERGRYIESEYTIEEAIEDTARSADWFVNKSAVIKARVAARSAAWVTPLVVSRVANTVDKNAVESTIAPIIDRLQRSSIELYRRMTLVGQ